MTKTQPENNSPAHPVQAHESGRNEPSIDSLIKLAEALDVTIDELVGIKPKSDELHLLSAFKKLDTRKKQTVLCLVDALLSP